MKRVLFRHFPCCPRECHRNRAFAKDYSSLIIILDQAASYPTYVARGVAALARASDAERWAGTIASVRQLADAYGFTDTDGSKPDCWGHLAKYGWDNDDERGIDEFR